MAADATDFTEGLPHELRRSSVNQRWTQMKTDEWWQRLLSQARQDADWQAVQIVFIRPHSSVAKSHALVRMPPWPRSPSILNGKRAKVVPASAEDGTSSTKVSFWRHRDRR